MYRQVQCLYCPSGCRLRLCSRPCTHGPGAAASLQVSARTRAPFSRASGLGDTGGRAPSACPTAVPQPPWPAGSPPSRRGCARQLSQATSQLLLSVRRDLRGAWHGPRGPWARGGPSLSSGTEGGRMGSEGSRVRGPGQFAAPLLGYLWAGGQRALARPPPATDAVLWRACPRWSWNRASGPGQGWASHPAPQEARADRMGTGRGSAWTLSPPSCRPPARRAPTPLKGALRGPAAHGGAVRGSAAENTGTSP